MKNMLITSSLLLLSVSMMGLTSVGEKSYKEATTELKQTGSVPLINALNRVKGKGSLKGVRARNRIVGGHKVKIEDRPWQVSVNAALATDNLVGHFCGGSLIAPNWVVTAAHCVNRGTTPEQIVVVSGTNDLTSGGVRTPVKEIIVHNKYSSSTNDNDIALLKLSASVQMTPVPLLDSKNESAALPPGKKGPIVSGWGYPKEDGDVSQDLLEVSVPIVERKKCNAKDAYDGQITDNMICAGLPQGGVDACQGDSGGPLVVLTKPSIYVLAGVVSWGEGCARINRYGVYTRVANYTEWVTAQLGPQ